MPEYHGILLVDKPQGFTSFDVVAKMRGIAKTKKIGHAGTLDPMATGVLPLFFGRATKACDCLPNQDKRYLATVRLGIATDTQDITGQVLTRRPVTVDEDTVMAAARTFAGDIMQIPPMYSALKVGGQKLCDLARKGVEVERKARPVTVYSIDCKPLEGTCDSYLLDVHCSKGTYIRTLAADLGEMLGCGATLTALRRTMAAGFFIKDCMTLEEAEAAAGENTLAGRMISTGAAFAGLPQARLSQVQTRMYQNGVVLDAFRVRCPTTGETFAVTDEAGVFLGTGWVENGELRIGKLFTLPETGQPAAIPNKNDCIKHAINSDAK